MKIASNLLVGCCSLALSASAFADKKDAKAPAPPAAATPAPAAATPAPAAAATPAPAAAAPAPAADHEKMMAAMEKAATPGPEHKALMEIAGKWVAATKTYMDPSKPPMESKGREECKGILGSRFLQCTYKGDMMGKPFEGIGVEGFDNTTKKYTMTWRDTMGTMTIFTEGTGDTKTRTFTGEETMPNGQKRPFRWVLKVDTKDKHMMEMYAPGPDGKEAKMMEIVYTRSK